MDGAEVEGVVFVDRRGFGFLDAQAGQSWFIPPPQLNGFLAGDKVQARVVDEEGPRSHVEELRLLKRRRRLLFGSAQRRGKQWFLQPDPKTANSWLKLESHPELRPGCVLLARLVGERAVRVERLLGELDPSQMALHRVVDRYEQMPEFSAAELAEAAELASAGPPAGATHRDLRDQPFLTIDAASTRDIDDALCVLPADREGCLRLLVAIADVAETVREGSAVDLAAQQRGTSTYLVGQVLPMLPRSLSEASLSLLPGEERNALVCELRIDPEGGLRSTDLYEARICSHYRLTYAEVDGFLHGELPADAHLAEQLSWLRTATARLAFYRRRRGGVEPNRFESEFRFDEDKQPVGLQTRRPRASHKLIELCMVAANEAVAGWLARRGQTALNRVHPRPLPEKIEAFVAVARYFGFEPGFGPELTPASLAAFDRQTRGTPEEGALWSLLLQSLGSARYATDCEPHFGLGADLYLHFTSPIRRYSDLVVHRLVKAYVRGRREPVDPEAVGRLAEHLNLRSKLATRAQNDHQKMVAARLLLKEPDELYGARVVAVNRAGVSVQLDSSQLRGWVPHKDLLGGPYELDEQTLSLRSREREVRCGNFLRVRLRRADPELGSIELREVKGG